MGRIGEIIYSDKGILFLLALFLLVVFFMETLHSWSSVTRSEHVVKEIGMLYFECVVVSLLAAIGTLTRWVIFSFKYYLCFVLIFFFGTSLGIVIGLFFDAPRWAASF